MKKAVLAVAVGVMFGGPFAVVACVGDEPGPVANATTTPDGSTPAPTTTTTATGTSTAPPGDDDNNTDAGDAGVDSGIVCHFANTTYPCDPALGTNGSACYGNHQDCTLTACGALAWQCNSPRQCNNTACCVLAATATATTRPNCMSGGLTITAGATQGASCEATANCATGEIQLCQFNADCPKNQYCSPVSVSGPASMNPDDLAVCVPY